MPRLKHFDNLNTARFVTFSCYRRVSGFKRDADFEIFIKHLELARDSHGLKIFGYVIMPNHVHLVCHPTAGSNLGSLIGEIKLKMAREYFSRYETKPVDSKRVFWQKRCYDHNCRTTEIVIEKINYCHNNPVRAGLVKEPGDWKWSSYNWYNGKGNVPILMDKVEI